MKRVGHLWERLISFANLLGAAEKARRGKRCRPPVAAFHLDLERPLWRLHEELAAKTYRPGPYPTFRLYEPKPRLISAAPYRDRVVHHALTNILGPVFERGFAPDSYACRRSKGTHAAVDRCQQHVRRFRYVLKADVRKFFPSMDHAVLKGLVARRVKDPDVLALHHHRPAAGVAVGVGQDQRGAARQGDVLPARDEVRGHGQRPAAGGDGIAGRDLDAVNKARPYPVVGMPAFTPGPFAGACGRLGERSPLRAGGTAVNKRRYRRAPRSSGVDGRERSAGWRNWC